MSSSPRLRLILCCAVLVFLVFVASFKVQGADLLVKPTLLDDEHNQQFTTIQQLESTNDDFSTSPAADLQPTTAEAESHHSRSRSLQNQRKRGLLKNIIKIAAGIIDKVDSIFEAYSNRDRSEPWVFHFFDASSKIEKSGGFQYKLVSDPECWEEAEKKCQTWGGHLVSIRDKNENNLVAKLSGETIETWIGYTDAVREGKWRWVDGITNTYTSWQSHQPDNYQKAEHCAAINFQGKGKWNDAPCALRKPYVCKRKDNVCAWDNKNMKAPTPVVKKEIKNDKVIIAVQIAQKANNKVRYAVGFKPYDTDLMCPGRRCITEDVIDLGEWAVCSDRCDDIVEMQMPLKDFIQYAKPQIINLGNNIVKVRVTLYVVYFDDSDGYPCDITRFEHQIEFETTLIPDIDHEHLLFPPDYSSVTVNQQGKLVIDLLVRPRAPQVYCTRFFFKSHSNNVKFSLYYNEIECAQGRQSCAYRLTLLSTNALEDYSGMLNVGFTYWDGKKTRDNEFAMELEYKVVHDPGVVVDVVETESKLTDETFTQETKVITPFERAFLLTKTTHPMGIPDTFIKFNDVFFCCSRDNNPIAPFQIGTDNKGCTVRDDRTMSYWAQLIKGGVLQSKMGARVENLGALEMDKVALSFTAEELGLTDRVCSIHVRTRLQAGHGHQKRSVTGELDKVHHLDSTTVVTFKGCSYYATESNCKSLGGDKCSWNSESATCLNVYNGAENDAGRVRSNVIVMGACVMFAMALLLL